MVLKMGDKISCTQVDCVLALCFECVTFGLIGIAMCSAHIRNERNIVSRNSLFLTHHHHHHQTMLQNMPSEQCPIFLSSPEM